MTRILHVAHTHNRYDTCQQQQQQQHQMRGINDAAAESSFRARLVLGPRGLSVAVIEP